MAFGGLVLTNRGRTLQAKAQTGTELKYTRIGIGDGNLGSGSILDLNRLINRIKYLDITKIQRRSGGRAIIGGVLSNQELEQGFYFREIGVFAEDPDNGEILYCYANARELAEYIPSAGGPDVIEKAIDVQTTVATLRMLQQSLMSRLFLFLKTNWMSKEYTLSNTLRMKSKRYQHQQAKR